MKTITIKLEYGKYKFSQYWISRKRFHDSYLKNKKVWVFIPFVLCIRGRIVEVCHLFKDDVFEEGTIITVKGWGKCLYKNKEIKRSQWHEIRQAIILNNKFLPIFKALNLQEVIHGI